MAKLVVEYLLDGDGSVPKFIEDGGYLSLNNKFIGISVDENQRHVPSTVLRLTEAALLARVLLVVKNEDGSSISQVDAESFVADFLAKL